MEEVLVVNTAISCVCIGIIAGCISWESGTKTYYLDVYKDILSYNDLRTFIKYIFILVIIVPYTITFLTYYIVSFKFVGDILFKDRRFL